MLFFGVGIFIRYLYKGTIFFSLAYVVETTFSIHPNSGCGCYFFFKCIEVLRYTFEILSGAELLGFG